MLLDNSAFITWLQGEKGLSLLSLEQDLIKQLTPSLIGRYLLFIGHPAQESVIAELPIRHKITLVTPSAGSHHIAVASDFINFPILPETIDAVILPHTLEWVEYPNQLLKEVAIALRPAGALILIGFHPTFSSILSAISHQCWFPHFGHLRHMPLVRAWLEAANFSVVHTVKERNIYLIVAKKNQLSPILQCISLEGIESWMTQALLRSIVQREEKPS